MSEQSSTQEVSFGAQISRESHPEVTVPEHEEWELTNGFAWVFPGLRGGGMNRPVIIADGFNLGRSDLGKFYQGLEADFPFVTTLRERGQAVILLGFTDRTASILENAKAAREAVIRANAASGSGGNLVVGGFSMGGLITRYTLAKMEADGENHGTEVYFSYDSPHRGGFLPIAAQALTHHTPIPDNPLRQMVDSPAAHEMLKYWYDPASRKVITHPERENFLNALSSVGWWPSRPRLIGVANGAGDGTGIKVTAGKPALEITSNVLAGSTLFIQGEGTDILVAEIKFASSTTPPMVRQITTSGLTELDSAPGGTLNTYEIVHNAMRLGGSTSTVHFPKVCFVPTVSALDLRDPDDRESLYTPVKTMNPDDSGLTEFTYADATTDHTGIVPDLCFWLLDRLQ
ncbi:hypothetical protein ACIQ6Y_19880 [Streptomyces sp. NPDC096205]|uniref:hypothetical protein n=1 Tax=Streptomyces sp. NPDC096205 TaxID=3366081 RepID=UPI0037FD905A